MDPSHEKATHSLQENGDDEPGEMEEEFMPSSKQIRVTFRLAPEFRHDQSLVVPTEAIAIPSHLTRKGLSTVLNHLLGREDNEENDKDDDDQDESGLLSPLQFDFLVGPDSRRLLRTSLDKEVRQVGLSLEQAVLVTYFPSIPSPKSSEGEGPQLPDWISALQTVDVCPKNLSSSSSSSSMVVAACYDGSLHMMQARDKSLKPLASSSKAHNGPIKCMDATFMDTTETADSTTCNVWMATGSMDHTVALHSWNGRLDQNDSSQNNEDSRLTCRATAQHAASVSTVVFWPGSSNDPTELRVVSGDWDGGVFVWRYNTSEDESGDGEENGPSTKKRKESATKSANSHDQTRATPPSRLTPTISLQAHNSKVSGLSFFGGASTKTDIGDRVITCSWDHSIKVWDMERQDCLTTLNTSRVVGCLDSSPHSPGICATGHPDCGLRLWDVRVDTQTASTSTSILVSDNVFRPSHKAWISQVQWSRKDPYQIYSCSHDGTLKIWDIRSALPLHTVRVLEASSSLNDAAFNQDKLFALATQGSDTIYTGGTTCIVEQFLLKTPTAMNESITSSS